MMAGVSNNSGCAIASLSHDLDIFSGMPHEGFDLLEQISVEELKDFRILKEELLSIFPGSALKITNL